MEAASFTETPVSTCLKTRCHISEEILIYVDATTSNLVRAEFIPVLTRPAFSPSYTFLTIFKPVLIYLSLVAHTELLSQRAAQSH
jgi:hypothetical protein